MKTPMLQKVIRTRRFSKSPIACYNFTIVGYSSELGMFYGTFTSSVSAAQHSVIEVFA